MDRREFLQRAALSAASASFLLGAKQRTGQRTPKLRKNVLLILTDDQEPQSIFKMPKTVSRMIDGGTRFKFGQVTTPQCGPSRCSLFTGKYVHNHGCKDNTTKGGTWDQFRRHEADCLPVWLETSGVTTAFFGKYMNGYGANGRTAKTELTRYVPPGWNRWIGWQGEYNQFGDYYKVNDDGKIKTFDRRKLHDTDYLSQKAEKFIRNRQGTPAPWFCMVSLNAPHSPSFNARRHDGMFSQAEMPRPPSFNELNVSDKPAWIRARDRLDGLGVREAQKKWRQRLRALQSVDGLVAKLHRALSETGQLSNTYIVFASDNGYMLWRHRVYSKGAPYRESMGVPFLVRGPGVQAGRVDTSLVANIDLAPTIAEWTGSRIPKVDGHSFAPLFTDASYTHRKQLLVEFYSSHPYSGVRTTDNHLYVEYENGDKEYYELSHDPYEINSEHEKPKNREEIANLKAKLDALKSCAEDTCRIAENAP